MTVPIDKADFADLLERAAWTFSDEEWAWFVKGLPPPVLRRMFEEFFHWQAHEGQGEPEGEWRIWFLRAGRGFGKTMAGAHWVLDRAREAPRARIALVGGSADEVRKVMIEGPGGLLAQARSGEQPAWHPTEGVVRFESGAEGFVYSARAPEKLRGPEHDYAWCDELAKWPRGEIAWDNLQMGMRRGERPRLIVTTTPRPTALVRRVRALAGAVETTGRTADNIHSAEAFRAWAAETYGKSRLGRQELDGELFEEVEGALWTRETIEAARRSGPPPRWKRIVVGVDPPVKADGDACGIVVCALGEDDIAYVVADCTVAGERPEGWARAVTRAADAWGADRVVAERNQGGEMVESVLKGIGSWLPVTLVFAKEGKPGRAEPVAVRFETGQAKLAGCFPELEDQLAGLTYGGGYEGPGRSPDRADAMVWAMRELIRPRAEPRIRAL
ncbi:MAG TPA: terminase family protein [Allosphingosinicella sp.]|nr:terminase family protein [Allosphingosinicella sp.]